MDLVARRVGRIVPHLTWASGPVSTYADAVWVREEINGVEVASRSAGIRCAESRC